MRPFKNIEEFKEKTGFSVGDVIITRVVQDWTKSSDKFALKERLITGFDHYTGKVYFGLDWYSVDDLFKTYEYLKDGKWLPFGVEVPEETENKKNAKFKVGHMYKDADKDGVFMVTAKYTSPHDNKTYLIIQRLSLHQIGQIICLIRKDENEDEFIDRYTVDYRPVKCSAKDEVEKIEKEIPLY